MALGANAGNGRQTAHPFGLAPMTPSILVYTCVFGGYDRIFPPVRPEADIDYVIVTDDGKVAVPGWRTMVVDRTRFRSRKAPNRYFKMLAHRSDLAGYDISVYVDGNIRVISRTREFVDAFVRSGAALGSYRHPFRSSVAEEAARCLHQGKLHDRNALEAELAAYRKDGFPDEQGLMETGVVLKNHRHPSLDPAMDLWWDLFERHDSRDQIGLPYVLWKLDLPTLFIEPSYRIRNPYFGIYPHMGDGATTSRYAYVAARSFDNGAFSLAFRAWKLKWRIQRLFRRLKGH
jgi:hypothetical protein